jgi:hypothetical protein
MVQLWEVREKTRGGAIAGITGILPKYETYVFRSAILTAISSEPQDFTTLDGLQSRVGKISAILQRSSLRVRVVTASHLNKYFPKKRY